MINYILFKKVTNIAEKEKTFKVLNLVSQESKKEMQIVIFKEGGGSFIR